MGEALKGPPLTPILTGSMNAQCQDCLLKPPISNAPGRLKGDTKYRMRAVTAEVATKVA